MMTIEEQIARARQPQVGDAYKHCVYDVRVVAVDTAFVRCVQQDGLEFETRKHDWPCMARNTILRGAKFTPAAVKP